MRNKVRELCPNGRPLKTVEILPDFALACVFSTPHNMKKPKGKGRNSAAFPLSSKQNISREKTGDAV